ncbi:hypothetical protein [Haliangium sp. UPWRP_2]|uniref:hypothetical protein n=1 Tax=Haliangium sp. UPWRP_2 TaxID=1931276 RepID=UPI000D0CF300|nr:hypothetical protein [Haliangium sp. UPWRP_2]PSM31051.1 hypothetical protein BVG81_007370 [Haliangium sp. UPWRP_2]
MLWFRLPALGRMLAVLDRRERLLQVSAPATVFRRLQLFFEERGLAGDDGVMPRPGVPGSG